MTHMPLKDLFEIARDNAARIFRDTGELVPMWHAVFGNGEHALIATPWCSDDEKDQTLTMLRALFAEKSVRRYVFLCEAWVLVAHDRWDGTPPSQHADRREVVRIHAEDRSGESISGMFYILRPEHGPPTLSRFHPDPASMEHAGRMAGMLA